jgi:MOSC domain-containing protein YiiM
MTQGTVVAIYIGPEFERPMRSVTEVNAVAGRGLEGDRYFQPSTPPEQLDPSLEITLIESEGVETAAAESGIDIVPEDTRRNVVTRGVRLEDLVGKTFAVGEARVEGLEVNPPCSHLEQIAGKKLLKPLIRHGGIRGRIVRSGAIRTGDAIHEL